MNMDIATRVHNHNWKIDPIVRSLLDTDFYKLLMAQMVHAKRPDTEVEFKLINRSRDVNLVEILDMDELRAQLNFTKALRLTRGESTWMRGNTFYGKRNMFSPEFMEFMENLQLPDYHLEMKGGSFELTFKGPWPAVMFWEIPALAIIMELKSRAMTANMDKFALDVLYSRAKARVWDKITRLRNLDGLRIADFGTRRRHSYLFQSWVVQAMSEGLGEKFIGTSNCHIAMQTDKEAVGTNAHELPQAYAALAEGDSELFQAPYNVCADWQSMYGENLRILLPDTYGTKSFLDGAPDWIADWKGVRVDSGDNIEIGEMVLNWWKSKGKDPKQKMLLFSDGLDTDEIEKLHAHFKDRCLVGYGWGSLLTNDFRNLIDCGGTDPLAPFSLVCKVAAADGRPAVKLSDNAGKAMGPPAEVERYRRVFRNEGKFVKEVVV